MHEEPTAGDWVERLSLVRHPEGGYYRESYRSRLEIDAPSLGQGFPGPRPVSTAIYYLLEGGDFSAFHRIRSDEIWHHYAGGLLRIHTIDPDGNYQLRRLAAFPDDGGRPQWTIPAGTWFAVVLEEPSGYALAGCTVAPGFDFADFEMADRSDLVGRFPAHKKLIEAWTRQSG